MTSNNYAYCLSKNITVLVAMIFLHKEPGKTNKLTLASMAKFLFSEGRISEVNGSYLEMGLLERKERPVMAQAPLS